MKLTDENYELFAAQHYDTRRACSFSEFQNDLKKVTYIRKLLSRYLEDDDLQMRLILNHIIVFMNCFGPAGAQMLFMKLDKYQAQLKPILMFLGYMPNKISYNEVTLRSSDITMDLNIVNELRKI